MIIHLDDADQAMVRRFVAEVLRYNRDTSAGGKVGDQSDEESDLQGFGGEVAFCRLFGIEPNTVVGERPDYDAKLPTGEKIDVKTTPHENGRLFANFAKAKKTRPDFYALMIGKFPDYRCVGFAVADDLLKEERLINVGYGKTYAINQRDLIPVSRFLPDYVDDFLYD